MTLPMMKNQKYKQTLWIFLACGFYISNLCIAEEPNAPAAANPEPQKQETTSAAPTPKKKDAEAPSDLEDTFEKKRFSLNVHNGDIRDVLKLIAQRGGLDLRAESAVSGKINVSLKNTTLAEALDQLAEENALEYLIDGDRITVKKLGIGFKRSSGINVGGRGLARAAGESAPNLSANVSSAGSSSTMSGVREIPLKYAQASQVLTQIQPTLGKEDTIIVDELSNGIIFQGSEVNFIKVTELVRALDKLPQQVLIEAQIIETSRSFLQAFGLNWGLSSDPAFTTTEAKLGFLTNVPGPTSATGAIRYAIGDWGKIPLEVRLSAAESNGDAKVISRPKVVTLNNTLATMNSGVTFNVKTLSALPSGTAVTTGGISSLNAGLQLTVLPTIMGKDLVKMKIGINNSQPDESQIVDGIPGIVNNSANTSVIVTEGRTAVIAGLVKNTGGRAIASVPFFANIPIVGALFRNNNVSDRNNELVIFITPQIVSASGDLKPERSFGEPKLTAPSTETAPGT